MVKCPPNPNAKKFVLPSGYRDIGWQLTLNNEDFKKCIKAKHVRKEFDNSLFQWRCTDVITICDTCKIAWHTDMSD